jgi:hypothetical protein
VAASFDFCDERGIHARVEVYLDDARAECFELEELERFAIECSVDETHHRVTEDTKEARRFNFLCILFDSVVNHRPKTLNYKWV